jgi:hypothetical protein
MATSILAPAQFPGPSSEIVVGNDEQVIISIYTDIGGDVPHGPVLRLQREDINGNFMTVATPGYGKIFLSNGCQQVVITTPGTYRVLRPDITAWGVNVGVQEGV